MKRGSEGQWAEEGPRDDHVQPGSFLYLMLHFCGDREEERLRGGQGLGASCWQKNLSWGSGSRGRDDTGRDLTRLVD